LVQIIEAKISLLALGQSGPSTETVSSQLPGIAGGNDVLVQLVNLQKLVGEVTDIEELSGYLSLKTRNDEMIEKMTKKRDEIIASGKPFKGEIRGLKLAKGTQDYLEYLEQNGVSDLDSLKSVTSIEDEKYVKLLAQVTEVSNQELRLPKCAKGTRDMNPLQSAIKEKAINIIKDVFQRHGASEIDTPVFERKETLTGKYGEESKLIYDLEDQGGELLSLRYDLTVPFARYVAENAISNIKRFHIAKVYRRDQPQMSKGRFREFYQCDFDIAGETSKMIPEAEVLKVVCEILSNLEVGTFVVKINNRKFLDSIIELSGCDKSQFKTICSSIDKLDKEPWEKVEHELITAKGLTKEMTDKLWEFVKRKGQPKEMLQKLIDENVFGDHKLANETIEEMSLLFDYLEALNCIDNISFDFSLARGLDYYTGLIYEAVLTEGKVGSIAGGGRYDELVGMFSGKNIPAVGVSIGIERIFVILEERAKEQQDVRATKTQVLVASIGKGLTKDRFRVCNMLWEAGFKAETMYNENLKPQKQLKYAFDNGIPLIIWLGEDEVAENVAKVKILNDKEEKVIGLETLVDEMRTLIEANPVLTAKEEDQ
jgi:histidyl-tRNA synthetase